jgi:putative PIN family toxin of toxin-antitoxin system
MKSVSAVFDTNVVVSALLFKSGQLAWLRKAWSDGQVIPLLSPVTARELLRVLAYPKFRLSGASREELLGDYLPFAQAVAIPSNLEGVPVCRDPFDGPFLELAVAARAAYLVTGDRDLPAIRRFPAGTILSPDEFHRSLLHEHR